MDDENLILVLGLGLVGYWYYTNYVGAPASGDGGDGVPGVPGDTPTGVDAIVNSGGAAVQQQPLAATPGVTNVQMAPADIYTAAEQALGLANITDISPAMLTTIAMIESSGNCAACRFEPALNDSSYGLCQTLLGTATWLYNSLGATALGAPTADSLADAGNSLYFGACYLHWLRNYRRETQSDEFVVRGYNGGPNGINESATANYWATFQNDYTSLGFS